jgi:hypothetical protein
MKRKDGLFSRQARGGTLIFLSGHFRTNHGISAPLTAFPSQIITVFAHQSQQFRSNPTFP